MSPSRRSRRHPHRHTHRNDDAELLLAQSQDRQRWGRHLQAEFVASAGAAVSVVLAEEHVLTWQDLGYRVVDSQGRERELLSGVSGVARKGIMAVMGPSGSGKTTLLGPSNPLVLLPRPLVPLFSPPPLIGLVLVPCRHPRRPQGQCGGIWGHPHQRPPAAPLLGPTSDRICPAGGCAARYQHRLGVPDAPRRAEAAEELFKRRQESLGGEG